MLHPAAKGLAMSEELDDEELVEMTVKVPRYVEYQIRNLIDLCSDTGEEPYFFIGTDTSARITQVLIDSINDKFEKYFGTEGLEKFHSERPHTWSYDDDEPSDSNPSL